MLDLAGLVARATHVVERAHAAGLMVATAESCTGGLIAGLLTAVPGSSSVVERGFVTYSNAAKTEMLGVERCLIEHHGAVSVEVAAAMAQGALAHSRADLAISVTGIAGPGGGSAAKPVGLVHFGFARRPDTLVTVERRFGDIGRDQVRVASVEQGLRMLEDALGIG